MAKDGFKVMDSDMHIVEPADLWERYIDPAFKDRAPRGLSRHPRDLGVQVGESIFPLPNRSYSNAIAPLMTGQQDIYTDAEARHWDSGSQVTAMDNEGIDMAVLFPSRGLFTLGADGMDPALATAISRAYNDWLAEFCAGGSDRMFGAGMIPPHDIEGAISEARRAVNELGFKTVFVRPNPVNGRNWHDAYYDPLWAEIVRIRRLIAMLPGNDGLFYALHVKTRPAMPPVPAHCVWRHVLAAARYWSSTVWNTA